MRRPGAQTRCLRGLRGLARVWHRVGSESSVSRGEVSPALRSPGLPGSQHALPGRVLREGQGVSCAAHRVGVPTWSWGCRLGGPSVSPVIPLHLLCLPGPDSAVGRKEGFARWALMAPSEASLPSLLGVGGGGGSARTEKLIFVRWADNYWVSPPAPLSRNSLVLPNPRASPHGDPNFPPVAGLREG